MLYEIHNTDYYRRKMFKFFKKHPEYIEKYEHVVDTLSMNPFHPSLRLHALSGDLKGFHAISLTYDYRVILELIIQDQKIILVDIGSHDEVY